MRHATTLAAAAFVAFALAAGAAPAKGSRAICSFENPAYSGECRVTADVPDGSTAQETCETVLGCLNDVQCTKSYCGATTIRSGWTLVSAGAAPEPGKKSGEKSWR
jgi:hypothetical protein